MDTKINVDRLFFDVTAPTFTLVLLHYSSDEPAHPVWGGGVKRKEYPATIGTMAIMQQIFAEPMSYLKWQDARPHEISWLMQQPGASPFPDPAGFDSTPPEMAHIVALARGNFRFAVLTPDDSNELKVRCVERLPQRPISAGLPGPLDAPETVAPIYTVTFRRHDAFSPWVAKAVSK